MRANALKLIVKMSLAACIALMASMMIWIAPGDYNHDLAALVNKRDLLISGKTPRIIFIGGSNLSTLKGGLIQHELNRSGAVNYSVINMGLWAGVSIKSYLDEIEPRLDQGDVIVICQEYATLLDDKFISYVQSNEEAKKFFFLMSPKEHALKSINSGDYYGPIRNVILLNQLKIKTYLHILIDGNFAHRLTGGYYRYDDDYSRYGDRKTPFKIVRPLDSSGTRFQGPVMEHISYLKNFKDRARKKHVSVYFLFPPFPDSEFRLNEGPIRSLSSLIRKDMDLDTLNEPVGSVFPETCFADTVNHLRPGCEIQRTTALIKRLRSAVSRPADY